jgi:hypothetical protein
MHLYKTIGLWIPAHSYRYDPVTGEVTLKKGGLIVSAYGLPFNANTNSLKSCRTFNLGGKKRACVLSVVAALCQ